MNLGPSHVGLQLPRVVGLEVFPPNRLFGRKYGPPIWGDIPYPTFLGSWIGPKLIGPQTPVGYTRAGAILYPRKAVYHPQGIRGIRIATSKLRSYREFPEYPD